MRGGGLAALPIAVLAFVAAAPAPATAAPKSSTERVTIESDGWRLVGDLTLPDSARPVPAVVLLHGAAGNRGAYAELAHALAAQGIGSLRIDLRGHGESTNRGRFVPSEGTAILKGTERDVAAVYERLRKDPRVDPGRVGLVGASYSGEFMMKAAAEKGWGAAYVALSPGSLSDESIAAIDREGLPFLMIVSRNERYLKDVAAALRDQSRTAEFLEVGGTEHATRLLAAHPDLVPLIAVWFREKLVGDSAGSGPSKPAD